MKSVVLAVTSAFLLTSTAMVHAQTQEETLKTLGGMRSTGKMADIPLIPQTGPKAD